MFKRTKMNPSNNSNTNNIWSKDMTYFYVIMIIY